MKNNAKIFVAVAMITLSAVILSSCGKGIRKAPPLQKAVPSYLANSYDEVTRNGITIDYNPQTLKPIPSPKKPYSPFPRNIPKDWIKGELEWPEYKDPAQPGMWDMALNNFYDNYIMETVPETISESASNNRIKTVIKLYEMKNPLVSHPGKLSKSDYTLVKVLDKAPDGELPQNQSCAISDDFVVWQASSKDDGSNWEIWGYDIKGNEVFPICSHKEYKTPRYVFPDCTIGGNDILLIDLVTTESDGKTGRKVIVYDLSNRKTLMVLGNDKYIYFFPRIAGGFLYANKSVRYDGGSQYVPPTNVVRINIKTGEEKVVIPNSYLFVSSSFDDKLCLVSIKGDYPYNDVWILDNKKGKLVCYMKIPINDTNTKPETSVTESGILYAGGQADETPYYFYSFDKNKAFYTGPVITLPDSSGRFLIMKHQLDSYYPVPPFDYEGKKRRMEGYNTFLIVKPD